MSIFKSPDVPAPAPPPEDPRIKEKEEEERKRKARIKRGEMGRRSTILTGSAGVQEEAPTRKKTLLGE